MVDINFFNILFPSISAGVAWIVTRLYERSKFKAETDNLVINNTRAEIENFKLIAAEWRETAEVWKDLVDKYQDRLVENADKIDELFKVFRSILNQRVVHIKTHHFQTLEIEQSVDTYRHGGTMKGLANLCKIPGRGFGQNHGSLATNIPRTESGQDFPFPGLGAPSTHGQCDL